ncbi:MAG: serine/threonine-protein kinase [Polyangiaceae bacterium]|nr:serine/threonine-protein kinase [Polyangiaceae bacterium]
MSPQSASCPTCGKTYGPGARFCPLDGAALSPKPSFGTDDPYLGQTLAGQFQILDLIGQGSTGRVYRAHDAAAHRDVAIKILHRELLKSRAIVTRFLREAKLASRLQHPNLIEILTAGELLAEAPNDGGEAYVVTEYLPGRTLRAALATQQRALPLPRALHIILQICDAVGEAHEKQVIHRDLKPENILLVQRGFDQDFVKVLDFGTARLDLSDATVLTQKGAVLGTARYASPECARGQKVTAASDVYSLATLLYECLSGSPPFDGKNPVTVLLQHMQETPKPLLTWEQASYVPQPIADIVHANLAKTPDQRCQNARAFKVALQEAAQTSRIGL